MTGLLDVNVLIAMVWPAHQAHPRVQHWLGQHAKEGWASCPFTQTAFVRILSNPGFSPNALTPQEALALLEANLAHATHCFWPDEISFSEALKLFSGKLVGHRQVSDAYLLGLAIHKNGRLVTLDRGILALPPPKASSKQRIVVIP